MFSTPSKKDDSSKPTFSFGGSGNTNSNNAGSLFGAKPAGSSSLFGNTQTSSTNKGSSSSFGSNPTGSTGSTGLFGSNQSSSQPSSSSTGLFSKPANTTSGSSLFGAKTDNAATSTPTSTSSGGLFGNSKPAASSGGLFGNNSASAASSTGGLFGNSKPAASTGGLFGNSDNKPAASNSGLFGNNNNKPASSTGGLFGNSDNKSAASTGGLFGNSKPAASSGGLFGSKPTESTNKPSFSLGSKSADSDNSTNSKPSTFSFGSKPEESKSTETNKTTFSFGAKPTESTTKPAESKPAFSFGSKPADSTTKSAEPKPAFSFGSKPTESNTKPAESKPAFSFGSKQADSTIKSIETKSTSSLFGAKNDKKAEEPKKGLNFSTATDNNTSTLSTNKPETTVTTTNGTKLVTVAPEPVSLENQTVQDLIKNWANKLSSCQTFFDSYSKSINNWDGILTENSEHLSKLYSEILKTEQTSATIDQNLVYLEKQQDDIESFLDYYENKINDIYEQDDSILLNNDGLDNPNSSTGGRLANDKKRETAYSNAILLDKSFDGLTNDLVTLIKEVNEVNDSFNNTIFKSDNNKKSKDGDEDNEESISNIIKLMNIHLNSLKWLEDNTEDLKQKIDTYKSI